MLVASEMGRAFIGIERNPEGSGVVSEAQPKPPSGFGMTQPVAPFGVDSSVPL